MADRFNRTKADDTAHLSLGQSSLVGMIGKFSLAILGFLGIVFFYRELGPTVIGIYYTILAAAKVATQFQSGITTAIQKRVSEVDADQSRYLGLGLLTWVGVTGIGVVAILVISPFTGDLGVTIIHLFAGLGMASVLGLFATVNQFYTGIGNPGKANLTDAVRSVFTLLGQVALVVIGFGEFGLVGGFIFGSIVTAVGVFILVGVVPSVPTRSVVERTLDFAKWSFPHKLANNLYGRLDILILWWVVGTTAVGYYQPAFQLTVPATFVAASISQSLAVKSSGLDSKGDSVAWDLRNSMAYAGIVAIPLFFGALAMPNALMRTIFGPSATAGAGALVGLALFQIARSYMLSMGSVLQGVDRPDLNLKVIIATLLLYVPLAFVLVESYGLNGIVAATVVSELFGLLITIVITANLFDNIGLPREIGEQVVAATVMYGVLRGVISYEIISITDVYRLGFAVGIGVIVYFLVLTVISQRFKRTVRSIYGETIPF